jgi:PAS domain-containing protein
MTDEESGEAVLTLDAAGHYVDANAAALRLLGVSLAELQVSAPDRFAMRPATDAEQAALRSQWVTTGAPPMVGTAGLLRADGATIRVAYAVEQAEAGFRARLWLVDGSPVAPTTLFTLGAVLRRWRSAERELAEVVPGTPEWAFTLSEIELLRGRYEELFSAMKPRPDARD